MKQKFKCIKDFYMSFDNRRRFTSGEVYEVIGGTIGGTLAFRNDIGKKHTLSDRILGNNFEEIDDSLDFKIL